MDSEAGDGAVEQAVIECARGQAARTRLDADGRSVTVRRLPHGVLYPFNYGYVEGTRVADGEEIDVFVLGEARAPGTRLGVRVLAAVAFADPRGDDPKLLAVEAGAPDPGRAALGAAADAVADFLRRYKSESEPRSVGGLMGRAEALSLVRRARGAAGA